MHETFAAFVVQSVPLSKSPTNAAVVEAINPCAFIIKSEKTTYSIEPAVTRTVRLSFSGSRDVYVADAWAVSAYLAQTAPGMPPLKDVGRWMKGLTVEQIKVRPKHST